MGTIQCYMLYNLSLGAVHNLYMVHCTMPHFNVLTSKSDNWLQSGPEVTNQGTLNAIILPTALYPTTSSPCDGSRALSEPVPGQELGPSCLGK